MASGIGSDKACVGDEWCVDPGGLDGRVCWTESKRASIRKFRVVAQGRLESDPDLLIDQLRAIDNRRLIDGTLLRCDSELMMRVYAANRGIMEA